MKRHAHTPERYPIKEVTVSDLTTIELLWLESASRIAFGLVVPCRRRSWTAIDASCLSSGSIFALCVGHPTTLGQFYPASISARGDPGATLFDGTLDHARQESLLRLSGWPKVEQVLQLIDTVEALDIDPADAAPDLAPRSQPTVGQRNTASMPPDPVTTPGSIGGGSRHERPACDNFHDICNGRSPPFDGRRSNAALHMERIK
jgi:hypothetical protein